MYNKGITLISLIITIISIIILAAIAIFNSESTPESAIFSNFAEELDCIQTAVAIKRTSGIEKYDDENYGFKKVTVSNAPEKFKSFDEGSCTGYLIDISTLGYEPTGKGLETLAGNTVVFEINDVYVYDKNGVAYYVKGFEKEGRIYFNINTYVEK